MNKQLIETQNLIKIQNELKNRIEGRGTDSKEVILRRMESAYEELNYAFQYDYVVLNDHVDSATKKIKNIILAEKNRVIRKKEIISKIREM